jgi:ferredoxin-NADP reductase/predicted pyridoxine 5'-phosphate oxidase superfamily flavin-nucleotide-binding protein
MSSSQRHEAPSPWHTGELQLQRSVGVVEQMDELGRHVIRDHLIDQHRKFYPQLPFAVLGAVDAAGDTWATLRAGRPGFLSSPDPTHLHIALPRQPADPADEGLQNGDAVALLGIELSTRRRNRVNGTIHRDSPDGFTIGVEQAYGNCPQYIQRREFRFVAHPHAVSAIPAITLDRLDDAARATIEQADTFFVASYADGDDGHRQVDVSHRGGKPGFVRVDADGVLTIPDFAGNKFFNTLGNFAVNPKAGLMFVDFDSGDLLQLTGDAEVLLDSPDIATFQGAERLWRFRPRKVVYRPQTLPLRWAFAADGWSPSTLMTGRWCKETGHAQSWRPFRIAKIVEESSVIRSLLLTPTDGTGAIPYSAGQHLPIRVMLPGNTEPIERTYTLSVAPEDGIYRISVKRDGSVSNHLHTLREGDLLEVLPPAGAFTIDAAERRPAVLLAAGVGVTPMLAMLRHLVYQGQRAGRIRPTWFFYSARSRQERAFNTELRGLVDAARGAVHLIRLLSDPSGAALEDYDRAGRIEMSLLTETLPFNDYDFYLCGPAPFMQGLYDGLRGLNIADARIYAETFGTATLRRELDPAAEAAPVRSPANEPVPVTFLKTGLKANWVPGSGSLLDLAEASGLRPAFSCRNGSCGTCRTEVIDGAVAYLNTPTAERDEAHALICSAVPGQREDGRAEGLTLDL